MVVTMLGLIVLYPMNKILIIISVLISININAQNILVQEYQVFDVHSINNCTDNVKFNQNLGRVFDYSISNDSLIFDGLWVYDLKNNLVQNFNIGNGSGEFLDLTVASNNIYGIVRTKAPTTIAKYYLSKVNFSTNTFVKVITFPNTIPMSSTCNYTKNKLIGISLLNQIIEIDTQTDTYQYLFTLPTQYLGYDFISIMQDDNCDENNILLNSLIGLGVFKIDFINKDLIQVCTTSLTDNGIASPHPYLSCLDLDKNNSTTNQPKDYRATLCSSGSVSICDSDIKVKTRPGFADSMRVWISSGIKDIGNEQLTLVGALPAGVMQKTKNGEWWFYFPKDYAEANIENLIKQIRYTNSKATPTLGERQITFYLYTAKVVSDPAVAHIFISKPQQTKQDYSACTGKTLVINGINIKKDTAFCTALKGKEGCDSTHCVTVTFSAKQSGSAKQNVCFGNAYTFKGVTYSKSGIYKDTLKSSQGCDSIVTYTFSVLNKKEGATKASVCFGQTYDFYGKNLTQSGDYEHVINAVNACDSTVKLTLSVLPKKEGATKASVCFGQSYDFYGKNLTQSGDYEHVINAANTCDSTVKLTLSILPKKEGATKASVCFGGNYDFYGKNLTQSGDYEHVINAANACDSTVKLTLSVLPKKEGATKASICSGATYNFYGKNLTQSGDYEHVVNAANACDSTVKLTLSVLPKKEGATKASVCLGQSYDFYGKNLSQSGDYEHVINAANACDSTVKLTLSVLPKKENTKQATTCEGVKYYFFGDSLSKSGNYEKVFKTKSGCDSLEKLTLNVLPKKEILQKASVCFGGNYDFYGKKLMQSGDYEHVIKNATVCDSTVKLTLSVLPRKEFLQKATTCEGVAYNFYGDVLTKSGNYEKMFKTKIGCDSLEKLSLQVVPLPILTLPTDITLTEGTSVKIKATVKADSLKSIAWLPATFLDRDNSLEVTTTPTENIDYQVVVKNKNGCESKASIKVFLKAKKKIFAPTAFSPNDDGFNDLFEVFLKADEGTVESYEIYDRWGNLTYQNAEPWSGKESSEGVYTYLVKVKWNDGKVSALSGDVTLIR